MEKSVIDTILQRRSIRAYLPKQIPDKSLKLILECGLYAPSGGDCQYSRFLVLQNPKIIKELNLLIQTHLASLVLRDGQWINKGIIRARSENYHFIYHAPTLIIAVSLRFHENSMANCACALENMQLAATALDLGACWSNQLRWLTDSPAIRDFLANYGLQPNEDVFGCIAVGYPEQTVLRASPRKNNRVILDDPRDIGL